MTIKNPITVTFTSSSGQVISVAEVLALMGVTSLTPIISTGKPNSVTEVFVGKAAASLPASKKLLSIAEVLALTGVGRTTLYAKLKIGEIQAIKLGRRTFIPADQLASYIGSLKSYLPKEGSNS